MSYLKFPALVAMLLLTALPKDSTSKSWQSTSPINFTSAYPGRLIGNPTLLGNYQSETLVPSNAWRGLVPLKSTRGDVERLLGSGKEFLAGSHSYETKEEKVQVVYSEGFCERSSEGQWNVPGDTVLSVTVFPQTTLLVSTLRLDKKKYSRAQEAHPENWLYYVSAATGVMVHAILNNGCEEVMSITYRPTTKDERLRCPKTLR